MEHGRLNKQLAGHERVVTTDRNVSEPTAYCDSERAWNEGVANNLLLRFEPIIES